MAINVGRDMKFSDLDENVKLMVTKWLAKEVKIALVDVFPPVVSQIKSVSLKQLASYKEWPFIKETNQAVELYKKLTNVKKITEPDGVNERFPKELVHAIGYNLRPNIEYFFAFGPEFTEGLKYVAEILKKYPDYDGSRIKNTFYLPNSELTAFLQKNPGLKLNLQSDADNYVSQDVKKLIKSLDVMSNDFQKLILSPIRFESLEKLKIIIDSPFLIQNIDKIRFLNSKITTLTVDLQNIAIWNAENATNLTNCIQALEHLKALTLRCFLLEGEWTDDQVSAFYSMATILLTAYKLSLSHIYINYCVESSYSLPILLWNNIRDGFKYLLINNCAAGHTFFIDKNVMKIKGFQPSLIDTFNKFPHVKQIKVDTRDEVYKQTLNDELDEIRSGLPRNKWLTLDFSCF